MITALIASQILLWAAVLALGGMVVALARQVGVLHERIAPAGALALNSVLAVGDKAPELDLVSLRGESIKIGEKAPQSTLIFFVSPDCPVCKTLLPIVRSSLKAEKDWIRGVLASDGANEKAHKAFVEKHNLESIPYVVSEQLGQKFGVSKLPYATLVDENGIVRSLGMVNTREHIESLFNAKQLGVASIQDFLKNGTHKGNEESDVKAG